ncbi:MAG: tetratricopeptide repeat protein, partial [Cyanobacteria bacterium J06632_3]
EPEPADAVVVDSVDESLSVAELADASLEPTAIQLSEIPEAAVDSSVIEFDDDDDIDLQVPAELEVPTELKVSAEVERSEWTASKTDGKVADAEDDVSEIPLFVKESPAEESPKEKLSEEAPSETLSESVASVFVGDISQLEFEQLALEPFEEEMPDSVPLTSKVLDGEYLEAEVLDSATIAEKTPDLTPLETEVPDLDTPDLETEVSDVEIPIEPELTEAQLRESQKAADDYFSVGYSYRSRIEAGERDLALIEPAIAAYEGGLRCLSGPHPDWASGLNDLGTLYWLKAQKINDPQQEWDCMNHSIELYQEALAKIDAQEEPDMVCQLYSNMGAVYSILATYNEPTQHFQRAVNAYCQALRKCPLAVDPGEYATLNNSLGSVYWKLSHYEDVVQNLQHAIAAYGQSLRAYDPASQPLQYASVQNNLGITYWSLAKHKNSTPALRNAITAYRDALNYRTPETDAAACAITYNNLALAYWDLSKDETVEAAPKLRYQKNAIIAFEAALRTAEGSQALSQKDITAIYHCLGDVHAQMVNVLTAENEIAVSLQKSLYSYVRSIEEVPEDTPIYQARLSAVVANLRSHKEQLGLASQQAALNRIPSALISQVMVAL